MNKKFPICKSKAFFYISTAVIILVGLVFNIHVSLTDKITIYSNCTLYVIEAISYGPELSVLILADSILQDVVILVVLLVLNILILISLTRLTTRRRRLQQNPGPLVSNAQNAEQSKLLMIVFTGVNYFFGHVLDLVLTKPGRLEYCFFANLVLFSPFLFTVSYCTPICLYFLFNNTFRSHVRKILFDCSRGNRVMMSNTSTRTVNQ